MRRGFSLVEVVIAVGIVAGSVAVVLSLLPSLIRQSGDSADLLVAQRMPDAVHLELERQATTGGFDALANAVPVMSAPLENGWALVATADGLRLATIAASGSEAIAADEQHFLVECWRFAQPPLSFEATAAVLPVYVRVSWPYRIRGLSTATRLSDRNQFTFAVAIDR